jgi:hypothetical protein
VLTPVGNDGGSFGNKVWDRRMLVAFSIAGEVAIATIAIVSCYYLLARRIFEYKSALEFTEWFALHASGISDPTAKTMLLGAASLITMGRPSSVPVLREGGIVDGIRDPVSAYQLEHCLYFAKVAASYFDHKNGSRFRRELLKHYPIRYSLLGWADALSRKRLPGDTPLEGDVPRPAE